MTKRKRSRTRRAPSARRQPAQLAAWQRQALYWLPRLLGILFTLYVATFAFEAFNEGLPPLEAIGAFLINLLPAYIAGGALVVAWRDELRGGLLLIGVAILFAIWFGRSGNVPTIAALAGPPAWAGLGFIAGWFLGATHASRTPGTS